MRHRLERTSWYPRYTVAKLPLPISLTITYGFTSSSSVRRTDFSAVELIARTGAVSAGAGAIQQSDYSGITAGMREERTTVCLRDSGEY